MDNFLQLVPMEADADDSDSALVYGEEDDLGVHEADVHDALDETSDASAATAAADDSAAQFFAPLVHINPLVTVAVATAASASPAAAQHSRWNDETSMLEQERARYLQKLHAMESATRPAKSHLDGRLAAVHRIRAMNDPTEQLSEYLPLLMERQQSSEAHDQSGASDEAFNAQVAAELLECARQMSDARDAEVALVAAFVFLSDAPHQSQRRYPGSMAPTVAALVDASGGAIGHSHPF